MPNARPTRATDENVPTALAGYRPRVTGTSSLTEQYLDNLTKSGTTPGGAALYTQSQGAAAVSSFGLTTTQTLFNGFQTANRTRQAEGQVSPLAKCCARPSRTCCSTRPPHI